MGNRVCSLLLKPATVIACSSLFITPVVQAAADWTEYAQVAELVARSQHYYQVKLQLDDNPSGCKNKAWFYQDYATHGSDKMYYTLLEALKSGNRVRLYVTGVCNLDRDAEFTSVGIIP